MRRFLPLVAAALALRSSVTAQAVTMADWPTGCRVTTERYRLTVDVTRTPMVRLTTPDGKTELARLDGVWVQQDGRRWVSSPAPAAHFHPLRSGPYLVELHLENVLLRSGTDVWPGLADVSLYCHEDRAYVAASLLCPGQEWVNRGQYVYRAAEGHRACPPVAPSAFGVDLSGLGRRALTTDGGTLVAGTETLALRPTSAGVSAGLEHVRGVMSFRSEAGKTPWIQGSVHEVGCMVGVAPSQAVGRLVLAEEAAPLPASAFEMAMGKCAGYDPVRGVYAVTAVTSGTPEPPRGLRAGARFVMCSDARARRILVDELDPWGGITGGILRDAAGEPLPVLVQFCLNFPELNAQAGEPGWATLTYPLTLRQGERREIRAEHLYHGLSDREVTYLNSLENVGDPLLLQVTVGGMEAHTLTTGPYPGGLTPGNELRINDFRRIYSQVRVRSVSAILPTFFGYWDAAGSYQGLMPGDVTVRETSPFLVEYLVKAATRDGAVSGSLRVWEAPHDDMTRVFTEVSLRVNRTVGLDGRRAAPLFFLRHHAFNPMAFMRFAYTRPDGAVRDGALSYARTVVVNRDPMGPLPLACLYKASNALDNGLPCSDITGNAGFVLLQWDVRFGSRQVRPGAYVFCTGEGDVPDGSDARDMAAVPTARVTELPAGSTIRYRAVQMVYGDNSSDPGAMTRERDRWALHGLHVAATTGTAVSADPPEFRAAGGKVECEVSGGGNWVPVRFGGMRKGRRLHVTQRDVRGARELGPGAPGEPWYSARPEARGTCWFTVLVKMPDDGRPVRLSAWQ